jgi:hypothetical protein
MFNNIYYSSTILNLNEMITLAWARLHAKKHEESDAG